jgi:hypothetical protein
MTTLAAAHDDLDTGGPQPADQLPALHRTKMSSRASAASFPVETRPHLVYFDHLEALVARRRPSNLADHIFLVAT